MTTAATPTSSRAPAGTAVPKHAAQPLVIPQLNELASRCLTDNTKRSVRLYERVRRGTHIVAPVVVFYKHRGREIYFRMLIPRVMTREQYAADTLKVNWTDTGLHEKIFLLVTEGRLNEDEHKSNNELLAFIRENGIIAAIEQSKNHAQWI